MVFSFLFHSLAFHSTNSTNSTAQQDTLNINQDKENMEDTAVNLAHRYASAAEEYEERNQWAEAVELHFQAADQFLLATKDTQNNEVIRTLKLMNANHNRQGKDLQRRMANAAASAAAAAAAAEAAAAASPHPPRQAGTRTSTSDGTRPSAAISATTGRRRASSGQSSNATGTAGGGTKLVRPTLNHITGDTKSRGDTGSGGSYLGTSSEASSNSSSAMIEESFTLIKNHVKDESDPFNKFWDAVENLVLKISNPVAFTSIPLDGDDPMQFNSGSALLTSPTLDDHNPPTSPVDAPFALPSIQESGEAALSTKSDSLHPTLRGPQALPVNNRQPKSRADPSTMQESFFIIDSPSSTRSMARNRSASASGVGASDSMALSSSSASGSRPLSSSLRRAETTGARSSTKTLEEYAIENQQLKIALDRLSRRNLKLEKHIEGAMQMSVWTKDIQRSAMQLIKSQDILRPVKQSTHDVSQGLHPPSSNPNSSASSSSPSSSATNPTPYSQMNPTTMQARLKELTEELYNLKLENAKQNSLMKKYKQRWEDLKESAKKRRNVTPTPPLDGPDHPAGGGGGYLNAHGQGNIPGGNRPPPSSSSSSTMGGSNPYANTTLVGHPASGSSRPLSNLARSASASGPVLSAGGSYQRRIIMENKGSGLDHTPLNMHRQSSTGVASSTSPRVLDANASSSSSSARYGSNLAGEPITPLSTGSAAASDSLTRKGNLSTKNSSQEATIALSDGSASFPVAPLSVPAHVTP